MPTAPADKQPVPGSKYISKLNARSTGDPGKMEQGSRSDVTESGTDDSFLAEGAGGGM